MFRDWAPFCQDQSRRGALLFSFFFFLLLLYFIIGVQSLYNVGLISAVQQSESAMKVKVLVTQLCLILCDPMDFSQPGSSVHGILQARILEWVTTSYFRGIFTTQGSTLGFLHCRQVLYCLSHQGYVLSLHPMPTPYSCLSIKLMIKNFF